MEKTFLNPVTNKQWRIEIDENTIRTCLNGAYFFTAGKQTYRCNGRAGN